GSGFKEGDSGRRQCFRVCGCLGRGTGLYGCENNTSEEGHGTRLRTAPKGCSERREPSPEVLGPGCRGRRILRCCYAVVQVALRQYGRSKRCDSRRQIQRSRCVTM